MTQIYANVESKRDETVTKRTYYPILGLLSILIILFLLGFIPRLIHWKEVAEEVAIISPYSVTILEVKPDTTPIELNVPSTTQAIRSTPIWARTSGYIKDFYVDIGDHVKKNQLLAEIETPEINFQFSQAKADLTNAIAKLEIAKITSERWAELFQADSQAVSPQEVEERQSSFQVEEAAVAAAQANVDRLEEILNFNKLYAPFSGTITQRNIDIGTLITAGSQGNLQQIYALNKTDVIRVFANVPQRYFRSIAVGGEADVTISEFPNKIFKGIIARTARALDPVARTLLTEIHIDNKHDELMIGLYANVKFILVPKESYFIVPTTAVIIRTGPPHVAVVDDNGIVHLSIVKIGRDFGKNIEITSGLNTNDRVVTNPNEKIIEGAKVNVLRS